MAELDATPNMQTHITETIGSLSLLEGHYVVIGSSVMQAAGIRYAADIDVCISEDLYDFALDFARLKPVNSDYSLYDRSLSRRVNSILPAGHPKGEADWPVRRSLKVWLGTGITDDVYPVDFEKAFQNSEIVSGIRMLNLRELMRWKFALLESPRHGSNPKHLQDIGLISSHLQSPAG